MNRNRSAIAIASHPDDIEFVMAGTLLLLKEAGYQVHYLNIASGNCGSLDMSSQEGAHCTCPRGQGSGENYRRQVSRQHVR